MQNKQCQDFFSLAPGMIRLNRVLWQRLGSREDFELTPTQLSVLIVLHKYGTANMSTLCDYMVMQKQQMTKIVNALATAGYVERHHAPDNRRVVLVHISSQGAKLLQRLMEIHSQTVQTLLEMLTPEDRERFLLSLDTIVDIITGIPV